MNGLIYIERARVVKCGEFRTGVGNNGEWATMPVRVEWEDQRQNQGGAVVSGKQSAVVVFRQGLAVWARDNVKEGNSFAGVEPMYLNLSVSLFGTFDQIRRNDGTVWLKESNSLNVEGVEVAAQQMQQSTAPQPGGLNMR